MSHPRCGGSRASSSPLSSSPLASCSFPASSSFPPPPPPPYGFLSAWKWDPIVRIITIPQPPTGRQASMLHHYTTNHDVSLDTRFKRACASKRARLGTGTALARERGLPCAACLPRGNNELLSSEEGTPSKILRTVTRKLGPESGPECLVFAKLARLQLGKMCPREAWA